MERIKYANQFNAEKSMNMVFNLNLSLDLNLYFKRMITAFSRRLNVNRIGSEKKSQHESFRFYSLLLAPGSLPVFS